MAPSTYEDWVTRQDANSGNTARVVPRGEGWTTTADGGPGLLEEVAGPRSAVVVSVATDGSVTVAVAERDDQTAVLAPTRARRPQGDAEGPSGGLAGSPGGRPSTGHAGGRRFLEETTEADLLAYDVLDVLLPLATRPRPPSPAGFYNAVRALLVERGVPGVPSGELRLDPAVRDAQLRQMVRHGLDTRQGRRIRDEGGSVRES